MNQLFLDANAHVHMSPRTIKSWAEFNSTLAGKGHAMSPSVPGRAAAAAIENARGVIAKLIGAESPNQIVFTPSCTYACEWAVSLLREIPAACVYSSPVEHPAVKEKYYELFDPSILPISADGVINSAYKFPNNCAVICVHVQNEIGLIQPIHKLQVKYLISDMSQGLGKIPIKLSSIPNLTIAMFGAHKFAGPTSVGFMYLHDTDLWKEFGTGSRYFLDRPGTPDTAAIVATAVALEEAINTLPKRYENMINFRDVLEPGLEELGFKIIGKNAERVPNTTLARVPKSMAMQLMAQLAADGIYIGLGSACGAIHTGPSPLMAALGIGGGSYDYVRISQFGEYASKEAKTVLSKIGVLFSKNKIR